MNRLELKIPPPLIFTFFAFLAWLIKYTFPFVNIEFNGQKLLTIIFVGIGGLFGLSGIKEFFSARTTINPHKPQNVGKLVTTGIYKITRNPMYLGLLLVLIGWLIYLGNILSIAALLFFVWYMNRFQIGPEEKVLEQKFGEDYRNFKQKTRRWI